MVILQTINSLKKFFDYKTCCRDSSIPVIFATFFYERTFKTEYEVLDICITKDRNGDFQQQSLAHYKRSNNTLEQLIIHLYEKGITISEISN